MQDNTMIQVAKQSDRKIESEFIGWQESYSGELIPLYNIIKLNHPSYRSTVGENTLRELHLKMPRTPSPYPGVRPDPWHEFGTELTDQATAREVVEAAGMNYTVVKRPWKDVLDLERRGIAFDSCAAVRADTGGVLGAVDAGDELIQNRDAFTFFDSLVEANEAIYDTAGSLGRGELVWILAKLPGYIRVQGRDLVSKYLLLSNSHDGSQLVRVKLMPIRLVCNNTLTAALQGAGEIQVRHPATAGEVREQNYSLLMLASSLFGQLEITFNRMAIRKISDKQLQDYLKALVPDNGIEWGKAKGKDIRNKVLDLYESGQGANFSRGTLWGAFNCVTEYTDHAMEDNAASRLESNWFGGGEELKLKAFQLAERMM
jgi:phage/plasmid-like protein (TIGR03299 family)